MIKHKVFISYHHENDQWYKEKLLEINEEYDIFIDMSVDTGDIDDTGMSDESIRRKIRDEYLRDSTVTIVLVGTETKKRKHVDWEIYSSMHDGERNKKSGILVIYLPTTDMTSIHASHGQEEKSYIHPEIKNWTHIDSRAEYERRYPYLPDRIIDCLVNGNPYISIVPWEKIENNPEALRYLIDVTHRDRSKAEYDFSRKMRRKNG